LRGEYMSMLLVHFERRSRQVNWRLYSYC
jgi:hypothetical protein